MASHAERDGHLVSALGKGRFSRNYSKKSPATCDGAFQRLAVWMMLGTALFYCHFAFFDADSLDGAAIPLEKKLQRQERGFFSGVHYREFGLNDAATVPPKKSTILYVYEQNARTKSDAWSRLMKAAEMRTQDARPDGVSAAQRMVCNGSRLENSILLAAEVFDTSVLAICAVRRMSIPRNVVVHPISSFNLDRDLLTTAYMEEKNLPYEKVNKSGNSWMEFKAEYSALSSLHVCFFPFQFTSHFLIVGLLLTCSFISFCCCCSLWDTPHLTTPTYQAKRARSRIVREA